MDRDYIKYFFIFVIIILILVAGGIFLFKNRNGEEQIIDKTSQNTNIKKNLRLAVSNFDTINPILSNNKNIHEITKIIYDSLIELDGDLKLKYCLAQEIGKTDNMNYIIRLRDDIYWSNGEKMTADDVKYTVDTIKRSDINSVYADNLNDVVGLEIVDEYTIKIFLDKEIPFFEYYLTFPILSRAYYGESDFTDEEKNLAPVSTGMFRISSVKDGKISLVKNEYYWNKNRNAILEDIDINIYNSPAEMYNAFKMGEIDIIKTDVSNIEDHIGFLGYNKIEFKGRNYDFISFNINSELFSNREVRRAINLAIDKNNLIATALGSGYKESNFFFDFESWLYDLKLNSEPNLDYATRILEEDGWNYKNNKWSKNIDGKNVALKFDLFVNESDETKIIAAENISSQLSNIGIEVNVVEISNENYINYLNNKDYDAMIVGIRSSFSPNLERFFGEDNIANYSNEEIKNILFAVKNTGDLNEIKNQYERLYDIYLEDVPYIGLYRKNDCVIYNQSLVCNLNPNSYSIFSNIEKWYRQ